MFYASVKVKSKTTPSSSKTTTTTTKVKEKREKKVYSLPGQKYDPPEEVVHMYTFLFFSYF